MAKTTQGPIVEPKRHYHHGSLRENLLRAARILIEEQGYDRFSLSKASELAGVSSSAPYKHFKAKEELLADVLLDDLRRLEQELLGAIEGLQSSDPKRLKVLAQTYLNYVTTHPNLLAARLATTSDDVNAPIQGQTRQLFDLLLDECAAILRSERENPSVRRMAQGTWAFLRGLSTLLINRNHDAILPASEVDGLLDQHFAGLG